MLNQKSTLARLLANENITVQQGNYETAFFDVKSRVLGLPLWKDMGKDVFDMLVGHEVSHALFTPENFHEYMSEGIPHSWLNIVEDVRIEKLILRKYPGLVGNFKRGYVTLMNDLDLFGVKDKLDQLHTLSFMDRLNLHAKARDLLEVPFADDELPFVAQAKACETYDDVVQCCRDIQAWLGKKAEDAETDNQMTIDMSDDDESQEMQGSASEETPDEDGEDEEGQGSGSEETSDEADDQEEGQGSGSEETDEEADDQEEGEGDTSDEDGEGESEASTDGEGEEDSTDDTKGEKGKPQTPESGLMDQEAMTDVNFNQKASELNDGDTIFLQGLTRAEAKASTVPYAAIAKARRDGVEERIRIQKSYGFTDSQIVFPETEYAEFLRETKQVVNLMVKEFEMRKAAYRSARARTSTRGTLDVNKLHRYKYDDQLFKQVAQLADAKNHGMMMLMDYSGSMHGALPAVQRQLLALLMFCKRVSIPFEVYAFTSVGSGSIWNDVKSAKKAAKPAVSHVSSEELALLEMFTSSMSKRDYEEAFKMVFWQSTQGVWKSTATSEFEDLGNTPLNTSLMAMQYKIEDFRKKYAVQKMNFVTLTDGDSNSIHAIGGNDTDGRYLRGREMVIDVNGKKMKSAVRVYGREGLNVTANLVKEIEKMGCSTMNYFIASRNYDVNGAVRQAITAGGWNDNYRGDFNAAKRDIRNTGVAVFDNNMGYQRRFILLSESASMQGEIDDLEVDSGMTAKKIAKQFGKSNGSKKKSRVITQKFAELVA